MNKSPKAWKNPEVLTSVASGILLFVGWLISLSGVQEIFSTGIYILAIFVGGYFFGREAVEKLIFEREVGIELLMSTAAIIATIMGEAVEGAMLVFLYSISEAAESYTEEKTRTSIKALMNLAPKVTLVRRNGIEYEVPVKELKVNDIFIVKPGQSLATDGVVVNGISSVNQAPVTGESIPVEKRPGDAVFAGSINGNGVLEVRATKAFADNTISKIIQMVESAQERKGQSQRFVERFGAIYSPSLFVLAILIALVPPFLLGGVWTTWVYRATVFIVAGAPCALVISIPITMAASLGTGARRGVLIKGGIYIEKLARVEVVALDKTGTLTLGEPEVTDVIPCKSKTKEPISEREILALAAGIELHSEHPLARAIIQYAKKSGIAPRSFSNFHSLPGSGASANYNNTTVYIGSPHLFEKQLNISLGSEREILKQLQDQGKTVVVIGDRKASWGIIAIRDNPRPNAVEAIEALRAVGVRKVVMLTGDNERTASAIAHELGIDEIYADLKPADKANKIREISQRFGRVAMVGDGVNDAPALAEATVGIAMGAAGTDAALETADVALMADNLKKISYALKLAHQNQSIVAQNLVFSTIIIGALVIGAVAGILSLPVAVLGHEVGEFIVIANGLRMLHV